MRLPGATPRRLGFDPEARRKPILDNFKGDRAERGRGLPSAAVAVRVGAAQEPGAEDVDSKPEDGDRDRLAEADRDGREETHDRLIGDEERDRRQNEGARKPREIAEFASAEGEARVVRTAPGEAVGERRQQEGARVGAHVQSVGDERDRAEEPASDDLGRHHRRAQGDHAPSLAFVLRVLLAEEHVAMRGESDGIFAHGGLSRDPGGLIYAMNLKKRQGRGRRLRRRRSPPNMPERRQGDVGI